MAIGAAAEVSSIHQRITVLSQALQAAQQVQTADIAKQAFAQGLKGEQIGERIQQARIEAIAKGLPRQAS